MNLEKITHTQRTMSQLDHALEILHSKGIDELERHATVARRNHCQCNECFCCTARWLADRFYKEEHYKAAAR